MEQSHRLPGEKAAFLAVASAGMLWGGTFLLGKIALGQLSYAHLILYRFWFAALALIPIIPHHFVPVDRRDWPLWLLTSFLGVPLLFLLQFAGLARTSVSHASLMVGAMPVLLSTAAVLFTGERMRRRGWLPVLASAAGAALIVAGARGTHATRTGPSVMGDALVGASLVTATAWVLLAKRLMEKYPPVIVSTYVLGIGTLMITPWVLVMNGPPPFALTLGVWIALALLGVVGTVFTALLWNWGLARVAASRASVLVNLEPLIGCTLGIVVLHDPMSAFTVAGGVLILGAAIAVTLQR